MVNVALTSARTTLREFSSRRSEMKTAAGPDKAIPASSSLGNSPGATVPDTLAPSRQTAEVELFGSVAVFMGADHTDGFLACQSDPPAQTHTVVQ